MLRIGVLALQGSVAEHMAKLNALPDVEGVAVKTCGELNRIDGIILPGGESTAIGKLLVDFGLMEPLKKRINSGMPTWGTCAGMILMAKEIADEPPHLGVMDIRVRRNAYGRQIDSFHKKAAIPAVAETPLDLIFIRAPWIEEAESSVQILCRLDGYIVAARQRNMLATSFHPELTNDLNMHRYFCRFALSGK